MTVNSHRFAKTLIEKRFKDKKDISSAFKNELETILLNPETFEASNFEKYSLEEVFNYLQCSHDFYLGVYIPKIENTLFQLQSRLVEDYWSVKLLILFIQSYKKELIEHIHEEEKVLFAFVKNLLEGKKCDNSSEFILDHFIHTHNDNVVIQLAELKKDLLTFNEDLKGDLIFEMLFNQLNVFQKDLMIHGLIEDHVFLRKIKDRIASKS